MGVAGTPISCGLLRLLCYCFMPKKEAIGNQTQVMIMRKKMHTSLKHVAWTLALLLVSVAGQAQFLRTSYFMDGAGKLQLNPANLPSRGYVNVPALGMFNASAYTNSLGSQDFIDMFDAGDDFWDSPSFNKNLKDMNKASISLNTDIISFGFYRKNAFWSFNIGLRTDVEGAFPRGLFDFLRDMPGDDLTDWNNQHFQFSEQELAVNAYVEVGVGYARPIGDRLTVGGKFNFLLGAGNLNLSINNVNISSNNLYDSDDYLKPDASADINIDARAEGNVEGLDLISEDGYVDDVEYNNFGISGYGAGIDLGATYRLLDNLTLSAAVLDLGFIKWSKSSSNVIQASTNEHYDANNVGDFIDRVSGGDVIDLDLLQMQEDGEKKARTTRLPTTLVLGGEYSFFNDKLSAGILSTTRWGQVNTLSELTFSANFRPARALNLALSYSMLQTAGKSFGFGIKLGPLMVGTDYMYLGENSRSVNAYLGLSFSMGKSRKNAWGK